jgi:hypothetical protein
VERHRSRLPYAFGGPVAFMRDMRDTPRFAERLTRPPPTTGTDFESFRLAGPGVQALVVDA